MIGHTICLFIKRCHRQNGQMINPTLQLCIKKTHKNTLQFNTDVKYLKDISNDIFIKSSFCPLLFNLSHPANKFVYLFLSIPLSFLPSGFQWAATSSQAHLLARANKTKATFPKLNLLLRLSSVNWEFSSLKNGRVAGWLLICSHHFPVCGGVCMWTK